MHFTKNQANQTWEAIFDKTYPCLRYCVKESVQINIGLSCLPTKT